MVGAVQVLEVLDEGVVGVEVVVVVVTRLVVGVHGGGVGLNDEHPS
jgi:hypothetical protein